MKNGRWSWVPLRVGRERRETEPGTALFQGLRVSLTLWYCAVLGAALLLFCVILYFGASYFLLNSVTNDLVLRAHGHAEAWQHTSSANACLSDGFPGGQVHPPAADQVQNPELVACFDQDGNLLQANTNAQLAPTFLSNTLAKQAVGSGDGMDNVDTGTSFGVVEREAMVVHSPDGNGSIGVVMIGLSVKQQLNTLSILLVLLICVGGITLLAAGLGGLFLANRALAPARLAFTRQQRFIADASHELRTPLTLLRADAEVLLRGRAHLAEDDVALLEDIVSEANHMSTLANSMLTLARLDTGSQHREHEVVSLDMLARKGVQRVAAFAAEKGVTVHYEQGAETFTIGDSTLLEQAVLILLDNAIKYNRAGGQVMVRTKSDDGKARLEIADTGIGIASEHLPHLSERFYRVDKARSREAGGAGLGLSIAHGIAIAHNGALTLNSTPDQGTTAILELPLAASSSRQARIMEYGNLS